MWYHKRYPSQEMNNSQPGNTRRKPCKQPSGLQNISQDLKENWTAVTWATRSSKGQIETLVSCPSHRLNQVKKEVTELGDSFSDLLMSDIMIKG